MGRREDGWAKTQIGEAEHDLSLPKIVGSAVGGWTPTIGRSRQTRQWTIRPKNGLHPVTQTKYSTGIGWIA